MLDETEATTTVSEPAVFEPSPADEPTGRTDELDQVAPPAEPSKKSSKEPTQKTATKKKPSHTKSAQKKAAKKAESPDLADVSADLSDTSVNEPDPVAKKSRSRRRKPKTEDSAPRESSRTDMTDAATADSAVTPAPAVAALLFKAPDPSEAPAPVRRGRKPAADRQASESLDADSELVPPDVETAETTSDGDDGDATDGSGRRRRRRGGRRRRKGGDVDAPFADDQAPDAENDGTDDADSDDGSAEGSSRRRRRRRRTGEDGGDNTDDPQNTVTRVRSRRSAEDEITAVAGSTRLEAKKQRRREGREAGRRRAPIVSEAEFLARRESVDRVMVVRQRAELTQIAVLEDKVLVEHYVARESQTSLIGNVYLGRVQNVLPSMEAAFVDIGKGRNAVLYAGEVNWSGLGHKDGQPRKIESVLTSGQSILVQVTKDPVGHKGARLSSQVSLAGRFLVYVPDGTTSGISRKLPDTERHRLKTLLKEIVPDTAGVIVRTAAEGASEDELTRDVERLKARWEDIEAKAKGNAPALLYGEPDLTLKVVRDLFTEDFGKLVIEGADAWDTVQGYVAHVAPDLEPRLERYESANGADVFAAYRIDEQIAKGLDRKVWLPSGGSLVIDRTEAMTVVDVNTGKFTGSGGNLEETVTRNNLEAADEIVRQLRLRDIGGIIVVDFIDMVLESNRDLVLRRLAECLGRDRTRHQVAEVTSLGLVQMTRKRIGTGLLEAFSENCEHCQGRGVIVHDSPVAPRNADDDRRSGRRARGRGRGGPDESHPAIRSTPPTPRDVAAVARPDSEPILDPGIELESPLALIDEDEVIRVPASSVDPEDGPDVEPGGVATVPSVDSPTESPEPTAPAVVVRTRRRSASRPAGPPVQAVDPAAVPTADEVVRDAEINGNVAVDGLADQQTDGQGEPPQIEHVPIKRKGARKR
jgi:ribonuclease E